jgi:hypothetical protein
MTDKEIIERALRVCMVLADADSERDDLSGFEPEIQGAKDVRDAVAARGIALIASNGKIGA